MAAEMPRLREGALDVAHFLADAPSAGDGAEVLFSGTVRNLHEGRAVTAIRYHAHAALAEQRLREIETEGAAKFNVTLRVAHAVGLLHVGDSSVVVLARSGHRGETFEAARWAIDTIKCAVPVWKEEHYADGSVVFQDGVPIETIA